MQKMQKKCKNSSEEASEGCPSVNICHLLGFHAAASAFPTDFEILHRMLVRNFVAHPSIFVFESNKSPILTNGFEMTGAHRPTRSRLTRVP